MKQYTDPVQQEAHDSFFIKGRDGPEEVLPPNTSREQFLEVVAQLRTVLGQENVITGSDLVHFVDPFAVHLSHIPSAAVCPSNVEEIQQVLKVVNQHKIPVWTCSRGKNLGYGGPAPLVRGSIVLSLYRMSSILKVSEAGAYAIVEPGVTFRDLSEYCLTLKPSVWPNVPSIGWGSVMGNALDRGIGYNMLGDHHHNISGLEVVLANGDIIRTGQWAADGAPTAHLCKNSFGPQIEGLFLQSNLGIVTKMSLWLLPRPHAYMSASIAVDKFDDIAPLIDALALLHREDILQSNPMIGDVMGFLATRTTAAQLYNGAGVIPDTVLEEQQRKYGIGAWTAFLDFYGTKAMVQARFSRLEEVITSALSTARIKHTLSEAPAGELLDARKIAQTTRGEPVGVSASTGTNSAMINFAMPPDGKGHGAHTDFVPLMPNDGQFVLKWFKESRKIMAKHGFNPLLGSRMFKKHTLAIQLMSYDSSSPTHRRDLPIMWRELARAAEEYHLTNYRSHLDNMDYCQEAFNFNDHAYRKFVESLKDKLDPNGILSPGKQGIWPDAFRQYRSSWSDEVATNDKAEKVVNGHHDREAATDIVDVFADPPSEPGVLSMAQVA